MYINYLVFDCTISHYVMMLWYGIASNLTCLQNFDGKKNTLSLGYYKRSWNDSNNKPK